MAGATGDVIQAAKAKVQPPPILLIINGIVPLVFLLWGLAQGGGGGGKDFDKEWDEKVVKKIEDDASKTADQKKQELEFANKFRDAAKTVSENSVVLQICAVAVGLLCIIGGVRMMSLKNRGLGIFASVVSFLPIYCCCCLGILIGIWSLIVLTNPTVKRGFEVAAGGSPVGGPADDLDPRYDR